MRQSHVCPKCSGRSFFTVEKAKMSDGQSVNGTTKLALAAAYVDVVAPGSRRSKRARVEAHVSAWICAGCGFAELYALDLSALSHLVSQGAEGVRYFDARQGPQGPFR